jgi:hypothetical protein
VTAMKVLHKLAVIALHVMQQFWRVRQNLMTFMLNVLVDKYSVINSLRSDNCSSICSGIDSHLLPTGLN